MPTFEAYIGLGSNLDGPIPRVRAAIGTLETLPDTRLLAASSLYGSTPVGYADQPDFVNAVARISTSLAPRQLLDALLATELGQGRRRDFANAPRTLDLDLLLYGGERFDEPGLCVPHPRMAQRAFVLIPLFEIAPHLQIPGIGAVADLLPAVAGQGVVRLEGVRPEIARTGSSGGHLA